ncbi:MAG: NAD(P)H-dependent oxidoreductase subunit E [Methylocystaceae bacterium]
MPDYKAIISSYQGLPGGIIEAYHALQKEYSYIPEAAIAAAAEVFDMPLAKAYGVATFYSYFKVGTRGRNVIRVCESAPCHVAGADLMVVMLEKELGIKMGETTADGRFTLEFTECVGQCQATPVFTINSQPYGDVSPDQLKSILGAYR